jgi:hypothetical protein
MVKKGNKNKTVGEIKSKKRKMIKRKIRRRKVESSIRRRKRSGINSERTEKKM